MEMTLLTIAVVVVVVAVHLMDGEHHAYLTAACLQRPDARELEAGWG